MDKFGIEERGFRAAVRDYNDSQSGTDAIETDSDDTEAMSTRPN